MRRILFCSVTLIAILATAAASDDQQQKAEKQLRKVSAMATDVIARGIVSKSVADLLKVKRAQLVQERRNMNLNYGALFLAHELIASGAKMEDIATQLKAGKTIWQIASAQGASWKDVEAHAKKLNNKIADNIFDHFIHTQADKDRDLADRYDSSADWVIADADATMQEILVAQDTYVLWRDRAAPRQDKTLGFSQGQVARGIIGDPVRDLAPKPPPSSPKK
jgi:hypothetical protein